VSHRIRPARLAAVRAQVDPGAAPDPDAVEDDAPEP